MNRRPNSTLPAGDRMNDMTIHKRHGKGQPGDQWVTCTLADFVSLLNGNRDHITD